MSSKDSTKAVDVVGVFDTSFVQVFPNARPMKATVDDEAIFFKHPLESSATRVDHIIFQPITIALSVVIFSEDYASVYKQIKQTYRDQTQLIVQTKVDTYENQYLQSIPHEEDPANFDSIIMQLNFYETKLAATGITYSPLFPSNSDTQNRGQQEPTEPNSSQKQKGSILSRWFG